VASLREHQRDARANPPTAHDDDEHVR
jgi:hypothetical protein